jgi:molybdate transport system substrate-binding protein
MAKVKVFCARSMTHAVNRIAAEFMRRTGDEIDITFGPVGMLQAKLAAGEQADVLILGSPAMAKMEQQGRFLSGTRADVARVSIGAAVRDGAPRPDISTADAFRRTLIAAHAIAFTDASVGGTAAVFLPHVFERLGIAEEVARKAKPQPSGAAVAECVARGEADIGLTLVPEIVPIAGAKVLGKLPAELADDTIYTAAVSATAAVRDAARAFIAALAHPSARDAWSRAGFDSMDQGAAPG